MNDSEEIGFPSQTIGKEQLASLSYALSQLKDDTIDTGTYEGGESPALATDVPEPGPGIKAGIKHLYKAEWYDIWKDTTSDLGSETGADGFEEWPLVARHVKTESGLKVHSIVVHSRHLRTFLDEVFEGYEGMSTKLKALTFEAPFREFFRRWVAYRRCMDDCQDPVALEHIRLLDAIINPEIRPVIEKAADLLKNGLITYEHIWVLFEGGSEVYSLFEGQDRYFRVASADYRRASFEVKCKYIDCDGKSLGYATCSILIYHFEGVKKISDLKAVPTHLLPGEGVIRQRLLKRGTMFESLNGTHYRSYTGPCIRKPAGIFLEQNRTRHIEQGRIMVDPNLYDTKNDDEAPSLQPIDDLLKRSSDLSKSAFDDDSESSDDEDDDGMILRKLFYVQLQNSKRRRPHDSETVPAGDAGDQRRLSPSLLALCTPIVRGYCLTLKEWVHFYVDNISEIRWSEAAFRRLVLPQDYKELILAFVKSQMSQKDHFDDVVQGKGKGMIILLSGEPGVGKTLTAESVAEEMRRPLYFLSAGELGDTVQAVEENLQEVLEISTKWNAVLLLDECDVFLEARTTADIQRNKLVTVFLRLLEYYKGAMFLTTNRMSTFDTAFQSRIHLSITYHALDLQSKRHIWRTFLRPSTANEPNITEDTTRPPHYSNNLTDQDIEYLSGLDLNGREIKNIIKTATLLASSKDLPLSIDHVKTVLRVRNNSNETTGKGRVPSVQSVEQGPQVVQDFRASELWKSIQARRIEHIWFMLLAPLFLWKILFAYR